MRAIYQNVRSRDKPTRQGGKRHPTLLDNVIVG